MATPQPPSPFHAQPPGPAPTLAPKPQPRPAQQSQPDQPWLWNVVLLDDQDHTYDYVIRLMQEVFNLEPERALKIAKTVDADGRAIVLTTHRELGELKVEQVHGFGRDPLLATCKGSMSAVLEPAAADPDDAGK